MDVHDFYFVGTTDVSKWEAGKWEFKITGNNKTCNIDKIAHSVIDMMGITPFAVGKTDPVVRARKLFCTIAYLVAYPNMSYASIGQSIGKDHATVLHHYKGFLRLMEIADPRAINDISSICKKLGLTFTMRKKDS